MNGFINKEEFVAPKPTIILTGLALVYLVGCESDFTGRWMPRSKQNETIPRVAVPDRPPPRYQTSFDWSIYEDPTRPEFWADGSSGALPRPFLHVAEEPSVYNAAKLLAWQDRQWQTIEKVIRALGGGGELDIYSELIGVNVIDHLARQDATYNRAKSSPLLSHLKKSYADSLLWENVLIIYVYSSSCPVCWMQKRVIEAVKVLGAQVIPLQLDSGPPLHGGSQPYHQGEWSTFFPLGENAATPVFFIVYRGESPGKHVGYISLAELNGYISTVSGGGDES